MKRYILLIVATIVSLQLFAQHPLYIVNGEVCESVDSIPPDQIENIEELGALDEVIAKYGERASNGVIIITLKHDVEAKIKSNKTLMEHVVQNVKWDNTDPVARVIVKYKITTQGKLELVNVLESTDRRLRRAILRALAESPEWSPATKMGEAVETEDILRIQLPLGRRMPADNSLFSR